MQTAAVVLALAAGAAAWDKHDYEIFDLASEIEAQSGIGTTFYSLFNLTKSATEKDIIRQFRRISRDLHPDKNPSPNAHEIYSRVNKVYSILKDSVRRARYDHFHDNGFPKWRGTGYYYSRWRPGLGSVLVALVIFTLIVQYLMQRLSHYLEKKKIQTVRENALAQAWGPSLTGSGRKKIKLALSVGSTDFVGGEIPSVSHSARTIPAVVDGDQVFIVDEYSGEELPLHESSIAAPSIFGTWLFALLGKLIPGKKDSVDEVDAAPAEPAEEPEAPQVPQTAPAPASTKPKARKRKGKKN